MAVKKPLKIGTTVPLQEFESGDTIAPEMAPGFTSIAPTSEVVNTSTFTAVAGEVNQANSTSGAITVNPPASPSVNTRFAVVDARATSDTNNITVDFTTASQKLYGSIQNYILNAAGGYVEFIYMGSSSGWVATKG